MKCFCQLFFFATILLYLNESFMLTTEKKLTKAFHNAIVESFPQISNQAEIPVEVVQSTQEKFGHYQCNSAMKLAKMVGMPPRQIAEHLVKKIRESNGTFIESLEIA